MLSNIANSTFRPGAMLAMVLVDVSCSGLMKSGDCGVGTRVDVA